MRTDNIVRVDAINVLLENLGEVDTERFISMIKRETFDYTEWRRGLFKNKTINEIFVMATEHEKNKKS
jgi:adenylylsulfate kinase-like enzyme